MAIAVLLFAAATPLQAQVNDPEDTIAYNGEEWVYTSGSEGEILQGRSEESGIAWCSVDPAPGMETQGLKPGALVYDETAKQTFFLHLGPEEVFIESIDLTKDRKLAVVTSKLSRYLSQINVFDYGTLALLHTFPGYTANSLLDGPRFAFTLIEMGMQRPEAAGMWARSAAVYAPGSESGYVVLKQATPTENFEVIGANGDEVTVDRTSVKSEADWEDFEKHQDQEIKVKAPAMK
jgi:hypothetical protein